MEHPLPRPYRLSKNNGASMPSTGTKSSVSTTASSAADQLLNDPEGMNLRTVSGLPSNRFVVAIDGCDNGVRDPITTNV